MIETERKGMEKGGGMGEGERERGAGVVGVMARYGRERGKVAWREGWRVSAYLQTLAVTGYPC